MRTQAYVHDGRWQADCPYPHCANAVALTPKQQTYHCTGSCLRFADVEWPSDAAGIWDALAERPVMTTRHWAPAGHRQAIACGFPDGQTVEDLRAETRYHQEALSG